MLVVFTFFRTVDSLALGYGKGKLTCFLGDPEAVYDVVSCLVKTAYDMLIKIVHSTQNLRNKFAYTTSFLTSLIYNQLMKGNKICRCRLTWW